MLRHPHPHPHPHPHSAPPAVSEVRYPGQPRVGGRFSFGKMAGGAGAGAGAGSGGKGGGGTPLSGNPHEDAEKVHAAVMAAAARNGPKIQAFETRAARLNAQRAELQRQIAQLPKSARGPLRARIEQQDRKIAAAEKAATTLRAKLQSEAMAAMAVDPPAKIAINASDAKTRDSAAVRAGAALLGKLIGAGHPFEKDSAVTHLTMRSGGGTQFTSAGGRRINLDPNFLSPAAVVHEYVHSMEVTDPRIVKAGEAFRTSRATGPRQSLKDLLGPDSNCPPDALGVPGKFFHPYVGRVYTSSAHTEVISMGAERLISDPVNFARSHPEHFKLTIAELRRR